MREDRHSSPIARPLNAPQETKNRVCRYCAPASQGACKPNLEVMEVKLEQGASRNLVCASPDANGRIVLRVLGGGTDIANAIGYCQQLISRPADTVLVLVSDLFEGGNAALLHDRVAQLRILLHERLVGGAAHARAVDAEMEREVRLRIEVDEQRATAERGDRGADVHGRGRLAHAALLVEEGGDARRNVLARNGSAHGRRV